MLTGENSLLESKLSYYETTLTPGLRSLANQFLSPSSPSRSPPFSPARSSEEPPSEHTDRNMLDSFHSLETLRHYLSQLCSRDLLPTHTSKNTSDLADKKSELFFSEVKLERVVETKPATPSVSQPELVKKEPVLKDDDDAEVEETVIHPEDYSGYCQLKPVKLVYPREWIKEFLAKEKNIDDKKFDERFEDVDMDREVLIIPKGNGGGSRIRGYNRKTDVRRTEEVEELAAQVDSVTHELEDMHDRMTTVTLMVSSC